MSADFSNLRILEFRPGTPIDTLECGFSIQTCQRTLVLSLKEVAIPGARRVFLGVEAYCYFLQFACGLESQIQGETDVFGQVKVAFRKVQETQPILAQSFRILFNSWLEDTKEIRAQYLQNIGGNNYGALARRLLNPQISDSVVVIGAGLVSKTVAPYFTEFKMKVWNRSAARLQDLAQQLSRKGNTFEALQSETELALAVANATIVILATPAEAVLPPEVISAISSHARVLHLGGQREQIPHLQNFGTRLHSLTDLFDLDREQSEVRKKQVRQALEACHQRSLLRSLARSIHISHGWEDLALFS